MNVRWWSNDTQFQDEPKKLNWTDVKWNKKCGGWSTTKINWLFVSNFYPNFFVSCADRWKDLNLFLIFWCRKLRIFVCWSFSLSLSLSHKHSLYHSIAHTLSLTLSLPLDDMSRQCQLFCQSWKEKIFQSVPSVFNSTHPLSAKFYDMNSKKWKKNFFGRSYRAY